MRYREELGEPSPYAAHPSQHIVEFTVWLTLAIGIGFIVAGNKGRQRWMSLWGWLTVVACAFYFGRGWIVASIEWPV